jgi:hypothetical protein
MKSNIKLAFVLPALKNKREESRIIAPIKSGVICSLENEYMLMATNLTDFLSN